MKTFKGKRIIDAKHPLTIHVKEEDIRSSKRANPGKCAIARCLIRDKVVESARVGCRYALIEYKSHYERYKVNEAAKNAIRDFDTNSVFVEGEYKLLPPPTSQKITVKRHPSRGVNKTPNNRPTKSELSKRPSTRNIFRAKEA